MASYHRKMVERMPWWTGPSPFAALLLPYMFPVGRIRGAFRKRARNVLGEDLITKGRWPSEDEEEKMKKSLVESIQTLDSMFESEEQEWICNTDGPSAADFALYGVLGRLVSTTGDSDMGVATPWLWTTAFPATKSRLQTWFDRIETRYPIVFRKEWKSGS